MKRGIISLLANAAGLIFGPIVDFLLDGLMWLIAKPVRLVIAGLLLVLAVQHVLYLRASDRAEDRRVQAAAWHGKFVAQKAEMQKFIGLVAAARVEAARLDRANIQRVEREWSNVLQEVSHDYSQDLAALRAAIADRLRKGTGQGPTGSAGRGADAQLPGLPTLSTGPVRPGDAAIVDGTDIDASTVNTLRLEHLIKAWNRAASIDVNGQR